MSYACAELVRTVARRYLGHGSDYLALHKCTAVVECVVCVLHVECPGRSMSDVLYQVHSIELGRYLVQREQKGAHPFGNAWLTPLTSLQRQPLTDNTMA